MGITSYIDDTAFFQNIMPLHASTICCAMADRVRQGPSRSRSPALSEASIASPRPPPALPAAGVQPSTASTRLVLHHSSYERCSPPTPADLGQHQVWKASPAFFYTPVEPTVHLVAFKPLAEHSYSTWRFACSLLKK